MVAKTLFAGWGDMDCNAHMKNMAFLDKSADLNIPTAQRLAPAPAAPLNRLGHT
jgi:hypothetical protein